MAIASLSSMNTAPAAGEGSWPSLELLQYTPEFSRELQASAGELDNPVSPPWRGLAVRFTRRPGQRGQHHAPTGSFLGRLDQEFLQRNIDVNTGGGTAMALWTMKPNGTRVLVIPAHRAYAAAVTEGDPLTAEESERLRAALREMDGKMGHAVHYGPEAPLGVSLSCRTLGRRGRHQGRTWQRGNCGGPICRACNRR